jgi:putative addiction module killer protein
MVPYVLPLFMVEVLEYLDRGGRSPFAAWSDRLNREAAVKVAAALARIQQGNLCNAKSVGAGVYEYRIDFGPGYRIYFGKNGELLVILVGGGTKKRQQEDIKAATGQVARLQAAKGERKVTLMALTRDFKDTIRARVKRDPGFRKALLREGIENFLSGDVETGKIVLRDFINATVGFTKLSDVTHRSAKSLMRMLGPRGNPQARNLFEIVAYLQQAEGVRFKVRSTRAALRAQRRPSSHGTKRTAPANR